MFGLKIDDSNNTMTVWSREPLRELRNLGLDSVLVSWLFCNCLWGLCGFWESGATGFLIGLDIYFRIAAIAEYRALTEHACSWNDGGMALGALYDL